MSDLVAFWFRDQFRAPEVLNELRRRDSFWVRDLDEAVAVTVNQDGQARVHLSVDVSSNGGTGWARLWGSLLNTTLFFPLAQMIGEAAGGLASLQGSTLDHARLNDDGTLESQWWRESLETSGNFKRDVAALMTANGSAILMLLRSPNTADVLKQLSNYGDTIVHAPLSREQDEKLAAMLAGFRNTRR